MEGNSGFSKSFLLPLCFLRDKRRYFWFLVGFFVLVWFFLSTVEELFHCCSVLHITFWPPEHHKTQEPFMSWNVSSAHESSSSNQH